MALNAAKEKGNVGGGKRPEPLEAANYLARVVQIVDLGIQEQRPYQGVDKPPAHEIMLSYELGTEFMKDEEGNDLPDKPRWISESFVLHNLKADLAKSTKRAKAIDSKGGLQGDFAAMGGFPCTVTVVQSLSKKGDGVVYNNVGNVTPPMKGVPVPELVNDVKVFDLDEPDLEVFFSLPEWIQDKVKGNLEFNGSALQGLLAGANPPEKKEKNEKPAPQKEEEEGDDNPF